MAELSERDKIEIELKTKGTAAFLELERQAVQTTRDIRDRDDKFNLWIVGLSAGAIAGLSVSPRLAGIPQWQAGIVFAFFVFSILFGTIYSWVLKEFQTEDDLFHYARQAALIAVLSVLLPRIKSSEEIDLVQARFDQIQEMRDPIITKQFEKVEAWERWRKRVYFVPPAAFVCGVIALAVVASINWPKTPPPDKAPTQVPQLRQG